LVDVVGGSFLRWVRWYQAVCPRSFAAEGVVRMTVYGPIHLGWRGKRKVGGWSGRSLIAMRWLPTGQKSMRIKDWL
jgi:hypothetical protein